MNPFAGAPGQAGQFGKEKFLFSAPPPPPPPPAASYLQRPALEPQDGSYANFGAQSHNGTLTSQQQQLDQELLYQLGAAAAQAKEYETQMLKMSVLFDDSHSFDEPNEQSASKELIQ